MIVMNPLPPLGEVGVSNTNGIKRADAKNKAMMVGITIIVMALYE